MRTKTFDLHDRAHGGDLEQRLRAWRAEGETFDAIAWKLKDQGIDVSRSTVHRWCHELGIEAA